MSSTRQVSSCINQKTKVCTDIYGKIIQNGQFFLAFQVKLKDFSDDRFHFIVGPREDIQYTVSWWFNIRTRVVFLLRRSPSSQE
jgi:hypothetical protein